MFTLAAGQLTCLLYVQVESTDTTSVVIIPVSLRSHSGRYTITAKNKSGQKHVNVRVIVLGKSLNMSKEDLSTFSRLSYLTLFCCRPQMFLGLLRT